jgi:hypothetical protein
MPAFHDLTSLICSPLQQSSLLVYSRQRWKGKQQAPSAAMSVAIPAPMETPLTALGASNLLSTSTALQMEGAENAGVAVPWETPLTIEQPMTSREIFVSKLACHTASIMAAPSSFKRSTKTQLARDAPQRSRRIAGDKVEFNMSVPDTRSRKEALRAMGIIKEQEGITEQAMEDYVKLFANPLTDAHLEALTTLFNWSISEFSDSNQEGIDRVLS